MSSEVLPLIRDCWMTKNSNFCSRKISESNMRLLRSNWEFGCRTFWSTNNMRSDVMSENIFTEWFTIIMDKHREKWRAYHTVIHLVEMLRYLEILSGECLSMNEEEKSILIMATFFHDAIYDPKSQSNEEDSAKLYQDFCSHVDVNEKLSRRYHCPHETVIDYILASKHHQIPSNFSDDSLLRIFLDMDLSVLGKVEDAYDSYVGLIREEYIHIDRRLFCAKRADILSTFLHSGNIFHSPYMKNSLEYRAVANLNREIEKLRKGIIPNENKGLQND